MVMIVSSVNFEELSLTSKSQKLQRIRVRRLLALANGL